MTLSATQAPPDDIDPGNESKIYPPTSTREANDFSRSTGGAPGHRGGRKNR